MVMKGETQCSGTLLLVMEIMKLDWYGFIGRACCFFCVATEIAGIVTPPSNLRQFTTWIQFILVFRRRIMFVYCSVD